MSPENKFADYAENKYLRFIEQDVCDLLPENLDVNFIIHAASKASPVFYKTDPVGVIAANLIGTRILLEYAKQRRLDGFLYFSSGEIYGQVEIRNFPIHEETSGNVNPLALRSCYAEGKRAGETLCVAYGHQYEVPVKIIRPFHTYGGGYDLNDGRVFMDFVRDSLQLGKVVMHSDGKATRSFCYISDAVAGFFTVLLMGKSGECFNVASQFENSILDFANTVCSAFSSKFEIEIKLERKTEQYATSPISRQWVSCAKLEELGWKEKYSLSQGVKRMINYYKEENEFSS
jgi:UDP-glucuronate decarboxylase